MRVLGIDAVVLGSDRLYATWRDPQLGEAASERTLRQDPERLLGLTYAAQDPREAAA